MAVANLEDPSALSHLIAGALRIPTEERQALLEEADVAKRLHRLTELLAHELEVAEIGSRIQSQVQSEMDKTQREYYLRQQLKAIQEELGEGDGRGGGRGAARAAREARAARATCASRPTASSSRLEKLPRRLGRARRHPHVPGVDRRRCRGRRRPRTTSTSSTRARCSTTTTTTSSKVKERILEYLAVRKLTQRRRRDRSCASSARRASARRRSGARSPARWGASSCASRSAACATRPRSAATGAPTSARCRAHRPGAARRRHREPGHHARRDRQARRGLPRRPGQRAARGARPRAEHDLPRPLPRPAVRPVAGAVHRAPPTRSTPIPRPAARPHGDHRARRLHRGGEARDRQALPASRGSSTRNGLKRAQIAFSDAALHAIIREYTREAGVRDLEREIGAVCRKVAREVVEGKRAARSRATGRGCASSSAATRFRPRSRGAPSEPGVATGLALDAGRRRHPVRRGDRDAGQGQAHAHRPARRRDEGVGAGGALLRCASRADAGIDPRTSSQKHDLHIHVPAGAIPKDGPIAGRHDGDGAHVAGAPAARCATTWR